MLFHKFAFHITHHISCIERKRLSNPGTESHGEPVEALTAPGNTPIALQRYKHY